MPPEEAQAQREDQRVEGNRYALDEREARRLAGEGPAAIAECERAVRDEVDDARAQKRGDARVGRPDAELDDQREEHRLVRQRGGPAGEHGAEEAERAFHDEATRATSAPIRPRRTRPSIRSSARVCQTWFFQGVVRLASKMRWLTCERP